MRRERLSFASANRYSCLFCLPFLRPPFAEQTPVLAPSKTGDRVLSSSKNTAEILIRVFAVIAL